MKRKELNLLDKHFAKYIAEKSEGVTEKAFIMLVNAIAKGDGDYVCALCRDVGHPYDMVKTAQKLIEIGQQVQKQSQD